jgi:hypothetical protein
MPQAIRNTLRGRPEAGRWHQALKAGAGAFSAAADAIAGILMVLGTPTDGASTSRIWMGAGRAILMSDSHAD